MTTMTRTDIHRPSAPEFDPENYDVLGFADFHVEDGFRPTQTISAMVDQGWSFRGMPSGRCGHCGTRLRYAALMGHRPTKTLLYVGETCLDNRFSATAAEFQAMRAEAARKAEQTRLQGKAHDFFAAHPDLVDLTYIHNISVAGGEQEWTTAYSYGEVTFTTEAEALAWLEGRPAHFQDHPIVGYKRGTTWDEKTRMGKWTSILSDMNYKVQRYGDLSDAQISFARKMLGWLAEAEEKQAVREAEQAAKVERGATVTAGRQVIEGEVTSTKWQENGFGGSLKMRVVNGDLAYWGSVPSSIEVEKGTRVRFTATVEPSSDDPSFGFFKRPSKAEVL